MPWVITMLCRCNITFGGCSYVDSDNQCHVAEAKNIAQLATNAGSATISRIFETKRGKAVKNPSKRIEQFRRMLKKAKMHFWESVNADLSVTFTYELLREGVKA